MDPFTHPPLPSAGDGVSTAGRIRSRWAGRLHAVALLVLASVIATTSVAIDRAVEEGWQSAAPTTAVSTQAHEASRAPSATRPATPRRPGGTSAGRVVVGVGGRRP